MSSKYFQKVREYLDKLSDEEFVDLVEENIKKEYRIEADFVFKAENEKDALLKLSNYFNALYNEDEEKEDELHMIVGELKIDEYMKGE